MAIFASTFPQSGGSGGVCGAYAPQTPPPELWVGEMHEHAIALGRLYRVICYN